MSQFKKNKGFGSRSPSPINSNNTSKIKSNHLSNQSGNYMNELQKANEKNQNLMASLLNDGVFEAPPVEPTSENRDSSQTNTEVPRIDLNSQEVAPQRTNLTSQIGQSRMNSILKPGSEYSPKPSEAFRKKSGVQFDNLDQTSLGGTSNRDPNDVMLPNVNNSFAKGSSFRDQLINKSIKLPENEEVPQPPQEGFYKRNLEQVLLVISLKKIVKSLQTENERLWKKSSEHDVREKELTSRVKKLEHTLEELQLREKLYNKHPSDYIKYDLEDLNAKLKNIDNNLNQATADNIQEKFLEDVVTMNRDYSVKSDANSEALKGLKDNMTRLKNTLMSMNAM